MLMKSPRNLMCRSKRRNSLRRNAERKPGVRHTHAARIEDERFFLRLRDAQMDGEGSQRMTKIYCALHTFNLIIISADHAVFGESNVLAAIIAQERFEIGFISLKVLLQDIIHHCTSLSVSGHSYPK